ncbi:MAG: hypothetical protein U9R38_04010 [Candidatus Margulisiibacteriota bacterium]|nr:hypothetical protein [Candidatus Margulisiibacteriota bacterium]
MAKAIKNTNISWRTRIKNWWKRRTSSRKNGRSVLARRAYSFSPRSYRPATRKAIRFRPPLGRNHSTLWTGFSHRYSSILNCAGVPQIDFRPRFLDGLTRLVSDPYRMMNKGLELYQVNLFYLYGELCDPQFSFHRSTYEAAERFIKGNITNQRTINFLTTGNNLRYFMYTMNLMMARLRKNLDTDNKQQKQEQRFTATVNFLNITMRVAFEKQRIEAVEIEADKNRQTKRARDKLREEKGDEERAALKAMIDKGYVIRITQNAINTRSEIMTSAVVTRTKGRDVVKEVLKETPRESMPALLETAVDLRSKNEKNDVVDNSIRLAASLLRADPGLIPTLVNELKNAYHNSFIKGAQQEADQAKVKVISGILNQLPEALPQLLQEYDRQYSWYKPILAFFGIKMRDLSSRVLNPIIHEAVQSRQGIDVLLTYVYDRLSEPANLPPGIYNQAESFTVAKGKLGKSLALQAVRSVLEADLGKIPVFADKSIPEEIRETILSFAKSNKYQRDTGTLTSKDAKALVFIAAKIQELMGLLRDGKYPTTETMVLFHDLEKIDGRDEIEYIRIPFFDNLTRYIEAKGDKLSGERSFRNADKFTEFLVTEVTRSNLFSAQRAIDILRGQNNIIWNMIPSPINEAARRNDPNYALPLVTFYTRYAYSFLTANQAQPDNPENKIRDIKSTLKADTDHKQLFLTLQSIPPAVKKEQLRNFVRLIEEAGNPELAARILAKHA